MFGDANLRSVMIESRAGYSSIYWEHEAAPPATSALVRAVRVRVETELGSSMGPSWVLAQHHRDVLDASDCIYAWRLDRGRTERIDPKIAATEAQARFAPNADNSRVALWWLEASGEARLSEWLASGEGAVEKLIAAEAASADV
jgi:hypothetical protein